MAERAARTATPSVDVEEVERFAALAQEWWDPDGPYRPLHRLNPTRLGFIRDRLAGHFERDPLAERPLDGLSILDIGCGGGLLAEPLTRLGARITGIDAAARSVQVAALHAADGGLEIAYRHATSEDLVAEGAAFDAVLNMEVVEHVADVGAFLDDSAALVRPGGAMVLATLNRTPKSFAFAIIGAEYLLRWLPYGTHDWRRFLRPSELAARLRRSGLDVAEITGVIYNPLTGDWRLGRDIDVNYMVFAVKP